MASVTLKNIVKVYDNKVTAVKNLNLHIEDKQFVVLVGPSGCGKSTALRMIAGLEEITQGELYIGSSLVNDVDPKERNIAMVFQNYALYPHMSVYKNMEFGLKMRKLPKRERDEKIRRTAEMLKISELLSRKPAQLSGGQRQRVALGRAMVREPELFLLDEPLSNLDAKLRTEMRVEISKLHKDMETTFVYVTHDQTEAMTMADLIVVMKDGLLQQAASPKEVYREPANLFVAEFIGTPQINVMEAALLSESGGYWLEIDGVRLPVPEGRFDRAALEGYVGKTVTAALRPECIRFEKADGREGRTACEKIGEKAVGQVELTEELGSEAYYYIRFGKYRLIAKAVGEQLAAEDDSVVLQFDFNQLHLFDRDTEMSLRL